MSTVKFFTSHVKVAGRFERLLIAISGLAIAWGLNDAILYQTFILVECSKDYNYRSFGDQPPFFDNKFECYWENFTRLLPIDAFLRRLLQGGALVAILLLARWIWSGSADQAISEQ